MTSSPATNDSADRAALLALEAKINAILPPEYVGRIEDVSPKSMGSAGLKYDREGKIAWGEIWTTFCHLALAGGPPHRGRLLPPVATSEALAHPAEQQAVVAEIQRAIGLCVELPLAEEHPPGWVCIRCQDTYMAAWLVRAIVAENVTARHAAEILYLPAGPQFRLEKEIKNVVVSVAKTCHYLLGHVEADARPRGLGESLIEPPTADELNASRTDYMLAAEEINTAVWKATGMSTIVGDFAGWIGLRTANEEKAVWMQRAIVVKNVLARRECDVLYVPVCLGSKPDGQEKLVSAVTQANRLWLLHAK